MKPDRLFHVSRVERTPRTIWSVALLMLLLFACTPFLPAAPDVTFQASVNRNQLAVGEQLRVDFQLTGTQSGQNFRPPDFGGFTVLSGPNQSTNFQMINGAVNSSVTYSYLVRPGREGDLTIGPATVEYQGNRYTTSPITVTVSKASAKPNQQSGQGAVDDPAGQIEGNLLLKVELGKRAVFQGEQLTVTYKIYTRVNVVNYNLAKVPTYTGFWVEEIDVPQQIQLSTEMLNGKQYRVGVLKKVALFPQREGTLEIGPMQVECVVQVQARRRSNDIFDQFFNDPFFGNARNVKYTVGTGTRKVTVKALPSENVPKSFGGAVGTFAMEAFPDTEQVAENEPVTFRIKLSGTGNIKLLEPPALGASADIDTYDPKVSDRMEKKGGRVSGTRTFEYLMIPRHAGKKRIPPVEFSYFDPVKEKYATLRSPEFVISVARGSAGANAPVAGLSREDVKLLGEDIRFIRSEDLSLSKRGEHFAGSGIFYLLAVSPFVFLGAFLAVMSRREKLLGDVAGLRSRKARNVARKKLRHAKHLLAEGRNEEFHTEISRALWGYCADKIGIPPADLGIERIRSGLGEKGAPAGAVDEIASIIGRCDFARFAPSSDHQGMEEMYDRAERLISDLEGGLK